MAVGDEDLDLTIVLGLLGYGGTGGTPARIQGDYTVWFELGYAGEGTYDPPYITFAAAGISFDTSLTRPVLSQLHEFTGEEIAISPLVGEPAPELSTGLVKFIGGLGAQLLYRASTGFEKAAADVDAQRIIGIYAEIIIDQWNPYAISRNNLPYLAWGLGVNLWEPDYWSEATMRKWTADQWLFKSLRGTPAAFRMALGLSGYDVTDMVRPPQGFYASPELTKEEYDAWIRLMPEIRIYFARREGRRGIDEFFAEDDYGFDDPPLGAIANVGFSDADFVPVDDGWVLRGRYAVIRHLGVDTPMHVIQYTHATDTLQATDYERLSSVGDGALCFISDEDFVGEDKFVDAEPVAPKLYTLALNREYSHDASTLALTTITPSLEPLTPRYERNSDHGVAGPWFFADDGFADDKFADRVDGGDKLLADRLYLLDPGVQEPMVRGVSFADVSRVGLPAYTAEIQVDLHTKETAPAAFCGDMFVDLDFTVEEDNSHRERAFRAIVEAKALRDTILVSFAPKRPVELGDFLQPTNEYDDWVADPL